jgi:hypothetical protein
MKLSDNDRIRTYEDEANRYLIHLSLSPKGWWHVSHSIYAVYIETEFCILLDTAWTARSYNLCPILFC